MNTENQPNQPPTAPGSNARPERPEERRPTRRVPVLTPEEFATLETPEDVERIVERRRANKGQRLNSEF